MPAVTLFESKLYRINPMHSIEMLVAVGSLTHPTTFIGHARVKGVLPTGESFRQKVSFGIPANSIFEAAELFAVTLEKKLVEMNKPKIVR